MKRVILSNGDKIVIEENIEKALLKLFNYSSSEENKNSNKDETPKNEITSDNSGIKEAADLFNKAIEAQKNGDWATYGEFINKLGDILNKMSQE